MSNKLLIEYVFLTKFTKGMHNGKDSPLVFLRVQLATTCKSNHPALHTYNKWVPKRGQNLELYTLTEAQQFPTSISKQLMMAILVETSSAPAT
jgi:hypothetical protein